MTVLPQEQRAAVKEGSGHESTAPVKRVPVPEEPGPGQILVKINWSGLCASDKSLLHDEWAGFGIEMSTSSLPESARHAFDLNTCSGPDPRYSRP